MSFLKRGPRVRTFKREGRRSVEGRKPGREDSRMIRNLSLGGTSSSQSQSRWTKVSFNDLYSRKCIRTHM